MVKNCVGGKGAKSKARKVVTSEIKEEDIDRMIKIPGKQNYAYISKNCGGNRLTVQCDDGIQRIAIVRGKMRTRCRLSSGLFVLVTLRDYDDSACDITRVYSDSDLNRLLNSGNIPSDFYQAWRGAADVSNTSNTSTSAAGNSTSSGEGIIFVNYNSAASKSKNETENESESENESDEDEDEDYGIAKNLNRTVFKLSRTNVKVYEEDDENTDEEDDDDTCDISNEEYIVDSRLKKMILGKGNKNTPLSEATSNLQADNLRVKKMDQRKKDAQRQTKSTFRNEMVHVHSRMEDS